MILLKWLMVTRRMNIYRPIIADLFANKYDDLYTSVGYNEAEMDVLRQEIEKNVELFGYDSNCNHV